jgi:Domain of unknown function (DUF5103)
MFAHYKFKLLSIIFCWNLICVNAQSIEPDKLYNPNIKTIKLFPPGNQLAAPILTLNSADLLELHFDELGTQVKNYSYTFELCNANWQPANLSKFDFIRGFQQQRILQYRNSSISQVNYVHYMVTLPERNCMPTKSGNYILKVFLNGNENNIAFTKRIYVVDKLANIGLRVLQPFNANISLTHQKLNIVVDASKINAANMPQQIQIAVVQNYKWNQAITNLQPAFIRGKILEYNAEQDGIFDAGKEYRWADIRSVRFSSDRVLKIEKNEVPNTMFLFSDNSRVQQQYIFYRDLNGAYEVVTTESVNPWWQSDYANVVFSYATPKNQPLPNNTKLYLQGEFTNNKADTSSQLLWNSQTSLYEKTLLLKQGFYTYHIVSKTGNNPISLELTEGNFWETENNYTVLVYFRSFAGRHDELIGLETTNSRNTRVGL